MRKSPMQIVREQYGSREQLVNTIMPLLETKDDDTRSKLMSTSNKKLIRIHETAVRMNEKFGTRKNLVEKITELRYGKNTPDDGFLKRVNEASAKRLLDMYTQVGGK